MGSISDVIRAKAVESAQSVLPLLQRNAARVDHDATFPVEQLAALRQNGLLGLIVPQEYGGLGADLDSLVEVAQVLAAGCLSTAMIWAMHIQQVDSLVRYASPALAEEVLPRVAAGEVYLASVTTEPASGGRLTSASAPLRDEDGDLSLERDAPIVTGGEYADAFLVTMRDSLDTTANRVTLVYANRAQLQLESSTAWDPMGMRGTHSVGMRICGSIPADQVVGQRGCYRVIAVESMIPLAHLAWSACWLGAVRSGYADVIALLRSRRRPGSLDPNSDLVAERLARIRIDLELVSGYLARVTEEVLACRADGRSLDSPSVQIHLNTLKVAAAELTFRAADRLIQLSGLATGYLKTSAIPLERHFRDLRSASLNFANDRLLVANGKLSIMDRAVRLI